MLDWHYRLDALGALGRAAWWRMRGMHLGRGARVHAGCMLRAEAGAVTLGERAELHAQTRLLCTRGGRFSLGAGSHLAPGAHLLVGAQRLAIGARVAIGPQAVLLCESNGTAADAPFVAQRVVGDVDIGDDVFLGARVTVLPGSVIESHVVVGAHALVRGRLASGWVYGGVPARPLRPLVPPQPGPVPPGGAAP